MANKKTARRALFSSVLALILCCCMLVGTTFAWFTDSVTSAGNKIQSGTLKIDLEMLVKENDAWTWKSIKESPTPIFNYDLWEPGYVDVKVLKIENEGNLALKWFAKFQAASELSILANVIDVYVNTSATQMPTQREDIESWTYAGTVADFVNTIETTTTGSLLPNDNAEGGDDIAYLGIALKMQESAGNEYQNLSIGGNGGFDIMILATQYTYEEDSFGKDYDENADYPKLPVYVDDLDGLFDAIDNGNNVMLQNIINVDAKMIQTIQNRYPAMLAETFTEMGAETSTVMGAEGTSARINGNGITIFRTEEMRDKSMIVVADGYELTLSNVTIDGGAEWNGEVDPHLLRSTTNTGMTTSGVLVAVGKNSKLVLNSAAVLQNNDGANAVNLGTKTGGTLILNGGEILNNHSAAGAIWGGGAITINSGKVNGNHGGIGGAIRIVTNVGTVLTMNGGEMNHNMSDGVGGAIWAGSSRSNNVYVLNGGEMAYNYSPSAGGAMYAGHYETVKIGGTFKMHDNVAPTYDAIRFHDHASLVMTGGEVYNQGDNGFFLNNNSASITGGSIAMNFGYNGGLGLTIGEADIDGVISYNLATNHNTAYLAAGFNSFKFTVNESAENFAQFNFKPAAGYTYTDGDEAKLICLNDGYETYWDAATSTFRLRAK